MTPAGPRQAWLTGVLECAPGRAEQMNHGARNARGDIFIFLHADTWLHSEFDRILDERGISERTWGHFDVRLSGSHIMFRCIERLMNLRVRVTGIVTGDHTIFYRPAFIPADERLCGYTADGGCGTHQETE